jgi:flagellar M-ring protein FliF
MAGSEVFVNNVKSFVRNTPKSKVYLYLFLFTAVIGGSIAFFSFLQKETYQTLFSGLSTEDASSVVSKLKELKVPYKLGMDGTAVYVPKEKVYDTRLMLASSNALPGGSGVGFELFDKTNYGMTEFMQNINYKRAIQGELSRTINQMPEVKASRVHLAIPEKTLFTDRAQEVTASVFLKLRPGRSLSKEQISGIVQLVAGSIEGLKPEKVSVIDSSGRILYQHGDSGSALAMSNQQFEFQRTVERRVEESIQSMLDKFLGAGKSIVRATVDLNLRKVEQVQEEYLPDKKVVTGEKKSKEKSVNRNAKAAGTVGVASNVPGPSRNVKPEGADKLNEAEKEEEQISYEVSKNVRKIVEPFGDIKRVSLAIVVDGRYEKVKSGKKEELKYSPRPQKEINDIKSLVSRAVGYDEARGDRLEVLNMPFELEGLSDEKELIEKAEKKEMMVSASQYAFYAIIGLVAFLFIVRPILNLIKAKARPEVAELAEVSDTYVKGPDGALALEGQKDLALVSALQDKALVSTIIKEWVKESR